MDHFDVLKRALKIAWEHKRLWVLGLFVTGTASVPGPSYTQTISGPEQPDAAAQIEPLARWAEANFGLVAALAAAIVFVGLVLFVLSIAAHGGLVWAANEAAEARSVRLADAWKAGFNRWGRTFMVGFWLFVPLLLVAAAAFAVALVPVTSAARGSSDAAAVGAFGTVCCGFPLMIVIVAASAVIASVLWEVALRYGVLEDRGWGQSLKAAWGAVWGKRGVWTMWLVMLLPRFIFGAAVGAVALLFAAPAAFAFYSGQVVTGAGLLLLVGLALAVPQAAFSTFSSSAWTVFFRRMTGKEQMHAVEPPGYPGAFQAPAGSTQQPFEVPPPPPPVPAAPPSPPAPPVAPGEPPSDDRT